MPSFSKTAFVESVGLFSDEPSRIHYLPGNFDILWRNQNTVLRTASRLESHEKSRVLARWLFSLGAITRLSRGLARRRLNETGAIHAAKNDSVKDGSQVRSQPLHS